jgi:hypothetical protein
MAGSIVTCQCGAKVRAPADATQSFRCPRCKTPLSVASGAAPSSPPPTVAAPHPAPAATSAVPALTSATLDPGCEAMCPICQTAIAAGEAIVTCSGCDQIHHQECWTEIGGCGTFGCKQAPAVDKPEQSPHAPLTAWGDAKKCPACGETIKSIAVRCRYCGTNFDSVDPMSTGDLRRQAVAKSELDSFKKQVIALFVASILGCLAPIIAIIAPIYLLPRRTKLAKSGPLFTIMGWTSIILSWIYSLLMLAFVLADS